MIYIQKESVPQVFAEMKRRYAHYDDLHKEDKDQLKKILVEEQGSICAYCMGRITMDNSTIEHYIPRNGENGDPALSLDYKNLFAVCTNGRDNVRRDRQCDVSRGNKDLKIDPCNTQHMLCIKYKNDGEIVSEIKEHNIDLTETLNLNNRLLKDNRKAAWTSAINSMQKFSKGAWTKDYVQKCYERYLSETRKNEYVGIILFELEKRLKRFK